MMKRLLFVTLLLTFVAAGSAQPIIDFGPKVGLNTSKISVSLDDYNADNITKMHFGAFGRVGWKKVYLQPEVYFTKKGGEFSNNPLDIVGEFDYSAVDVPVLFGVRLLNAKAFDLHLMGGPVFGFITKKDLSGSADFDTQYFKDRYLGIQYGVGADVLFFTVDLRMENSNTVYDHPDFDGKNTTFLISVGFKIL